MPLPLVDAHCHVPHHWLDADAETLRSILRRCERYDVEAVVVSVDSSTGILEHDLSVLRRAFAQTRVRLGIVLGYLPPTRPEDVAAMPERLPSALAAAKRFAGEPDVIGLGEVGLDYYWPPISFGASAGDTGSTPAAVSEAASGTALARCREAQISVFR